MSASLLKKSLDIVEGDLSENKTNKNRKSKRKVKEFEIMSKEKCPIQEIRKRKQEESNKAEKNLAKLLQLSSKPLDKTTVDKIIKRARTGRYVISDEKPKEEEKSIFTEEDFKNFEKEYFGS